MGALFLHGATIVVLAIYMIVGTVAGRVPDGGCVVGDGILSTGADVLWVGSSSVFAAGI